MINIYFKSIKSRRFEKINEPRDGSWINIENVTKEDLGVISKITGLNKRDLKDCLDPYELPRIERQEGNNLIIFLRSPRKNTKEEEFLYTHPITIIINDRYFITSSIARSRTTSNILKKSVDYSTTQRGKFLIYILLKISQRFNKEIKNVRNTVLSQKVNLKNIKDSDISKLVENEDILTEYIAALVPMRNVLETLAGSSYINFHEEDKDLFQDVSIAMKQCVDICNINIKSIQSLRDSYQIIFTNRLNRTIKFLTAFTILMTIPTTIASFFGMNVGIPLASKPHAFLDIIIISVFVMTASFYIFVRKKWL